MRATQQTAADTLSRTRSIAERAEGDNFRGDCSRRILRIFGALAHSRPSPASLSLGIISLLSENH